MEDWISGLLHYHHGRWEVETHRKGGEKKVVGVSEATPEWGFGQEYCSFGGYWGFLGCGV